MLLSQLLLFPCNCLCSQNMCVVATVTVETTVTSMLLSPRHVKSVLIIIHRCPQTILSTLLSYTHIHALVVKSVYHYALHVIHTLQFTQTNDWGL